MRWTAKLLAVVLAFGSLGATAPRAAGDATDPPTRESSEARGSLPGEIVEASLAYERARAEAAVLGARLGDAQAALAASHAELRGIDDDMAINRRRQTEARRTLRGRAGEIYRARDTGVAWLSVDHALDLGTAAHYADTVAPIDGAEVARLAAQAEQLGHDREDLVRSIATVTQRRDDLADDLVRAQRRVETTDAALRDVGGLSVMGPSVLTPAEIAGWFLGAGRQARLDPSVTVEDVARLFVSEGHDEGVRGDVAFAQSIVETGSFGSAPANNYAGIGWCDSCADGIRFATPRDGVRAQIQLLRNYADPGARADRLAHPPSPGLYGSDPVRAADLYDTFPFKGKAPLWNGMGAGNWATDPAYAGKVLAVYAKMIEYAAQLRGR